MSWHHRQIFLLLWFFIWSCLTIFTIQVKHMESNTREQNKKHILLHEIRSIFSPWRAHSLVYRIYTSENWGRSISCIRMHWWRSIAACRAQTCWVYLSLVVFFSLTEHSTALERNPNVLTTLRHLHLFARQGQVPWTMSQMMERILSKVHWLEEPGQAGPGRFSTPGTSTSVSLVVRSPQLSCSPSPQPRAPARAAAAGPTGWRCSCSAASGCSAPLLEKKKRQESIRKSY